VDNDFFNSIGHNQPSPPSDRHGGFIPESGPASLRAIAAALNERGIRTPRGVGEWQAGTVAQLLARLPA
jgi:hypothetical protein